MAYSLPYLIANRYQTFYLRFMIPCYCDNGDKARREVRFSLRTKIMSEALVIYQLVLPTIKTQIKEVPVLNKNDAESIAQVELMKNGIADVISKHIEKVRECAANNNHHWRTSLAERQLKHAILDHLIDPMSDLIMENQKNKESASSDSNELEESRNTNKRLMDVLNAFSTGSVTSKASAATSDNKPLHELNDIYTAEKKPSLAPKTYAQLVSTLERFNEIIGFDIKSESISSKHLDSYCNVTKTIQPNFNNNKKVSKPTDSAKLSEFWINAAKNNTGRELSSNGVERHFSHIRPFLRWCADRHSTSKDYSNFPGLRKLKNAKDVIEKIPFSSAQLNQIFDSYLYSDSLKYREQPKNHQFWLPFIALTSGMRIAEIVGIEKEDIKKTDDVWVFDVNETWNSPSRQRSDFSKSKKNKSSCRQIPISQRLIDAGFLDYVNRLKKYDSLFPELTLGKKSKGLGDYASKWFNERYLLSIKLDKRSADGKQGVSFHSFRHSFVTNLDKAVIKGNTLNDSERHYITGHEQEGIRNKTYNHMGVNLQRLKTFVDAIDHEIDLSNISFRRFLRRKSATA